MNKEDISDLPVPQNVDISDLPSPPPGMFDPTAPRGPSNINISPYESPTIGERLGATAYGMATGLAGGFGELEQLGRYKVPEMLGLREEGAPRPTIMGRETVFPTIKEAESALGKIGIQRPREEVSGARALGELISGFAPAIPRVTRSIVGTPTLTRERNAQRLEQLGFRLSPAQVRADIPIPQRGATFNDEYNQKLANQLASAGTGRRQDEISREFLQDRFANLGVAFDNLYANQVFNIDRNAVNAIRDIANIQNSLPGVATTTAVQQAANNILMNFRRLARLPGAQPNTFAIEGEQFQRLRNALSQAARSTSNRGDAHQIYNLIDAVDDSIQRNHPQIADALARLRPQYRNTVILEDLMRRNGIRGGDISLERLGNMLGTQRDAVRRGNMDIDELGRLGREAQMRARWEEAGGMAMPTAGSNAALTRLTGLPGDIVSAGLLGLPRSRMARTAQRQLARMPGMGQSYALPAAQAAGVTAGQFREEE